MANEWLVEAGQILGKNDAGIEMFKKGEDGAINSLVRENIQNSLDAINDENEPVKVVFKMGYIKELPGTLELEKIFKRIKNSKTWLGQYDEDINSILETLKADKIPVLKVSDYNTKGAEGARSYSKTGIGTKWTAMTEINGQTIKNGSNSAGSFGIGKNANRAISKLQTIFFSSKTSDDDQPYSQGWMMYASIVDENSNPQTSGNSYYYKNDKKHPIKGELPEFSVLGTRNETGTDIFIPGIDFDKNFAEKIRSAVIENFLVAIYRNQLYVEVVDENSKIIINKDNLSSIIEEIEETERYKKNLVTSPQYFNALNTDKDKIINGPLIKYKNQILSNEGDMQLFIHISDSNFETRKVLMTRGIGMKIFEYPKSGGPFPLGINFSAVLMITGDVPNALLKKIENPEHTGWDNTDKFKENLDSKQLIDKIRKFIREQIIALLPEEKDVMSAYGMEEFLTLDGNELGSEKNINEKLPEKISTIDILNSPKPMTRKKSRGKVGDNGDKPVSNKPTNKQNSEHNESGLQRDSKLGGGKGTDYIDVTSYLSSLHFRKNEYKVYDVLIESTEQITNPKFVFEIVGDSSVDTKLNLNNVRFFGGDYKYRVEDASIVIRGLLKPEIPVRLQFDTDFDGDLAFNIKVLEEAVKDEN